jgi:hypothetical protein
VLNANVPIGVVLALCAALGQTPAPPDFSGQWVVESPLPAGTDAVGEADGPAVRVQDARPWRAHPARLSHNHASSRAGVWDHRGISPNWHCVR